MVLLGKPLSDSPDGQSGKTIKSHWDGVFKWAYHKISNGILEGFNSLIHAAKLISKGYRIFDTIRIINLITGKIDFSMINRCALSKRVNKEPV